MKKYVLLVVMLFALGSILVACGESSDAPAGDAEETESTENEGTEEGQAENDETAVDGSEEAAEEEPTNEDSEEETQENDGFEHQVGDTIENEAGEMTLIARNAEVGTHEDGPMVIEFEQVNTVSGKLKGEFAEIMETEELEYIQIDINVENTTDDTVNYYADQATITTNTGEQLDMPDGFLSDHLGGEYIGAVSKSGSLFYVLENSKAEEIGSIRILIDSPSDENYDNIGEGLDLEVNF